MGDIGCRKCRFCLEITYDGEFDIIGEITRQKLDSLLLKLNLDRSKETVICNKCAAKLQISSDFKSACLDAQPKFLSLSTYEEYLKEDILNKNATKELIKNQKLCRFCMKVTEIGSYTCLQEKKENVFILDMVKKHIPELNFTAIDEIVSCESCLNSLQDLLSFIRVCCEADEKVKENVDENDVECQLEQNDSNDFALTDNDSEDANVPKTVRIKEEREIDISVKVEVPDEDLAEIQYPELNIKDEDESFPASSSPEKRSKPSRSQDRYKCNSCPYKTRLKRLLKKHMMIHQDLSEATAYKCEKCMYVTNRKYYLKKHVLTHRTPSEIKFYKCEKCSYETKHESSLTQHMKTHRNSRTTEVKMYYCNNCSFESKYRRNLRQHVLTHRDLSELQTYKCHRCLYGSNRKSQLKRHMLIHQDISEVKTYKCEFEGCSYVTKRRDCVKGHMMIHKNTSEMFKCQHCDYETKRKNTLYIHTMNHHNPLDTQVYKCGLCLYETPRKGSLKSHVRTHRDPARRDAWKRCGDCAYKTKSKVNFKQHQLVHQTLSEVTVYKCERCTYETNQEGDLAQHILTHSELVVIKTEAPEVVEIKTEAPEVMEIKTEAPEVVGIKAEIPEIKVEVLGEVGIKTEVC